MSACPYPATDCTPPPSEVTTTTTVVTTTTTQPHSGLPVTGGDIAAVGTVGILSLAIGVALVFARLKRAVA